MWDFLPYLIQELRHIVNVVVDNKECALVGDVLLHLGQCELLYFRHIWECECVFFVQGGSVFENNLRMLIGRGSRSTVRKHTRDRGLANCAT